MDFKTPFQNLPLKIENIQQTGCKKWLFSIICVNLFLMFLCFPHILSTCRCKCIGTLCMCNFKNFVVSSSITLTLLCDSHRCGYRGGEASHQPLPLAQHGGLHLLVAPARKHVRPGSHLHPHLLQRVCTVTQGGPRTHRGPARGFRGLSAECGRIK